MTLVKTIVTTNERGLHASLSPEWVLTICHPTTQKAVQIAYADLASMTPDQLRHTIDPLCSPQPVKEEGA